MAKDKCANDRESHSYIVIETGNTTKHVMNSRNVIVRTVNDRTLLLLCRDCGKTRPLK